MSSPLACVVCSVDPQTSSLLLPLAQATILAAPVLLRDQLRKGVRAIRARRGKPAPTGARLAKPSLSGSGPNRP